MTKEERIRYLKGLLKCELCEEESTKICKSCDNRRIGSSAKCYDALKEVIKALEQEQKAINEWCTDCKEYDHEKHCCPRFSQVIKSTVQEMHDNQWVLCSKRLPEERKWIGTKKFGTTISDEVYVTLETTDGKRFCDHIRFQNGKFSLSKQAELDAIDKGIKAIAWMKLPLPYQPKDGEKE